MCKIVAKCALCGYEEKYELSEPELETYWLYQTFGRDLGMIQDLFQDVSAWIWSGAIDQFSDRFSICSKCQG